MDQLIRLGHGAPVICYQASQTLAPYQSGIHYNSRPLSLTGEVAGFVCVYLLQQKGS